MRASSTDFTKPSIATNRVVESFDGFVAYLLIVDEASRHVWVFPWKSKEPPVDLVSHFLHMYGCSSGGVIRCDQGGELAWSSAFWSTMMSAHLYVTEPTGADSPSQNGGAEKWNDTLAVTVRALLYGAALPAKYWSAALTHAAYLHNRRVHRHLHCTPFEKWYGRTPNLKHLRVFGSRVCVKQSGSRHAKLDRHNFTGIFLGYTATDENIRYVDIKSGIVLTCHHAVFDECWYHQHEHPLAAQLLFDLGLAVVASKPPLTHDSTLITTASTSATPGTDDNTTPTMPLDVPTATLSSPQPPMALISALTTNTDATAADHYHITKQDIEQVYCSPHCFGHVFHESFEYMGSPVATHPTAGLLLSERDGRVFIDTISPGTPSAKIPRWCTCLKQACLLLINDHPIMTIEDARHALHSIAPLPRGICHLLLYSGEIRDP
jgi:hypothetical protein